MAERYAEADFMVIKTGDVIDCVELRRPLLAINPFKDPELIANSGIRNLPGNNVGTCKKAYMPPNNHLPD